MDSQTLEEAMKAMKMVRFPDGSTVEVPDHRIRSTAIGLMLQLVSTPGLILCQFPAKLRKASTKPRKKEKAMARPDYKARFAAVRVLIRTLRKVPATS
jgi:hypothetical protein